MPFSMFRLSRHFCTQIEKTSLKTPKACIQSLYNEPNLIKLVENFKKFSEIPRVRGHAKLYEKAIIRLASANKFPLIEDLLEHHKKYPDMKKEGFAIRLISLYGKADMTDHAHKVFDEMPERECTRTVKSLNTLLNAYVHAKKFDEVGKLFRELPVRLSINPDDWTYSVVLQALCEKGELDSAEKMLDEMENNGVTPSKYTFNILMNGFYSNGRFDDGERVWDRMEKSGIKPDLVSFNGKLKGLIHVGKISEAVNLFEELNTSEGLKPDVISYNILLRWYGNAGHLDEAKGLYDRLKKSDCIHNRVTYEALITCSCEKEDLDFALELCMECVNESCYMDVAILQTVIDLLVKGSRVEEAKELLKLANFMMFYRGKLNMPATNE